MTAEAMTGEGRDGDGPFARLVVARLRWALSGEPGQAAAPVPALPLTCPALPIPTCPALPLTWPGWRKAAPPRRWRRARR